MFQSKEPRRPAVEKFLWGNLNVTNPRGSYELLFFMLILVGQ
jgi:hypothetical protein